MKKLSREINIFSMSALDLFASALGAFILITVVLFPYFPNTGDSPERVAAVRAQLQQQLQQAQQQLQQQLQQSQADLDACRSDAERTRDELESCQQQIRRRFLLILISWSGRDDVDLHVVDPQGREFYFSQKTHAGTRAKLEEDNIQGPGNEIWLHPQALPGEYKIYYRLYAKRSNGIGIRGAMLTPEGKTDFPDRILSVQGRKVLVAVIQVDNLGHMTLSSL